MFKVGDKVLFTESTSEEFKLPPGLIGIVTKVKPDTEFDYVVQFTEGFILAGEPVCAFYTKELLPYRHVKNYTGEHSKWVSKY